MGQQRKQSVFVRLVGSLLTGVAALLGIAMLLLIVASLCAFLSLPLVVFLKLIS